VTIPRRPRQGPTHVVVDSTGLKIFGEGEWKVRQHGVGKRRTWRKIHLAVDESTKDIIGIEVTTADWGDSEILPGLLDQVEGEIAQVSADGAYDSHGCHVAIAERGARATIPPREGAVAWGDDHPRDAILQEIEAKGKSVWKNESGYHRRSIAANMMYRLKQLGDSLYSRTFERQVNEAHVRAAILNTFTYLGHAGICPGRANCACCMTKEAGSPHMAGKARQGKAVSVKFSDTLAPSAGVFPPSHDHAASRSRGAGNPAWATPRAGRAEAAWGGGNRRSLRRTAVSNPRPSACGGPMLDPGLPFGAGAGAALAWPRLCFAAESAHTSSGRQVSSAPREFFANDLPQVGFEVTAFDDAAKGVVDDRLVATLTSQRLEVFDDWRVAHDVDPQLADALAHCGLPLGAADLPAGDSRPGALEVRWRQLRRVVRSIRLFDRRDPFHCCPRLAHGNDADCLVGFHRHDQHHQAIQKTDADHALLAVVNSIIIDP
jgi:hypothetical protein